MECPFGLYVSNFDTHNETYGSLGAIIVVLVRLDATALVVVVGAEINAENVRRGSGPSWAPPLTVTPAGLVPPPVR